jgi:hypothetical protein
MALNDEIMGYMLTNAYKRSTLPDNKSDAVKADITEKEALEIFNEIVDIYKKHNVSYQCACKLSIALNEAFMTGAVELYRQVQLNPYRD